MHVCLAIAVLSAIAISFYYSDMPLYGWVISLIPVGAAFALSKRIESALPGSKAGHAYVVAVYSVAAFAIFYPVLWDIFRADYWLIALVFQKAGVDLSLESLRKIALFEMFGHIRFQPLAHLTMFARHLAFGNNIVLYNIVNIAVHIAVACSICYFLFRVTGDRRFSMLFGLLFAVLTSQFDAVGWNYHIYILTGTLFFISALILALEYHESNRPAVFIIAAALALTSLLMYEAAILAPLAILLPAIWGIDGQAQRLTARKMAFLACVVIAAYALWMFPAYLALSITQGRNSMSFSDLLGLNNLSMALLAVAIDIAESFIKNSGVLSIDIQDHLVCVILPRNGIFEFPVEAFKSPYSYLTLGIGISILAFCRVRRQYAALLFVLAFAVFSYLLLISMGRVLTNNIYYIVSQPRYQYFPDALAVCLLGILLWPKYRDSVFAKGFLYAALLLAVLWNSQNTWSGNRLVADSMKAMDGHFYRISDFLKSEPGSRVLLDFSGNDETTFLGGDIAFDILFKDRITMSTSLATHVYDGRDFTENRLHSGVRPERLGDFSVRWRYQASSTSLRKDIGIAGREGNYPVISVMSGRSPAGGAFKVAMKDFQGNTDSYALCCVTEEISEVAVEKEGSSLCLIVNGVMRDRIELNSDYMNWGSVSGPDMLGEYYEGMVDFGVSDIVIRADEAMYGCSNRTPGKATLTTVDTNAGIFGGSSSGKGR